ncbi:uncharacterized protein LOC119155766 [Falco rusticolus]|uniref:uncharacterized protein LOC119155766 n=1 Tax=Falco rusticolus TaxID=120794 RepID=UPI001886A494|nr:uncharacterized protein LOC119155766 [Falco rusticolus]XP_055581168.1 uncharacterized protein LOC114016182 [Falco cherrug]
MIEYCNNWWPLYTLDDQEKWPMNGTLNYNTTLQLMLFCRRQGKWSEMPYVDLFFYLRQRRDWQNECKLTSGDNLIMAITSDNKKVKKCCSTCEIGKDCLKKRIVSETDEGPELDTFPPRRERNLGREYREQEQVEEPESSGIEDVEEGLSEIAIRDPVSRRTRQQAQTIAPLRQGVGNNGPVYVKVPFSVMDLMAWKQAAGIYREDPERVGRVVDTIIRTQNPDWNDLQVILNNLLDDTEKQMVLKTGKAQAEVAVLSGTTGGTLEQNFPSGDPQWDPNNVGHRERLSRYQKWILYGVKHAMPKSLNWSKLYEVRQDKNESPSTFLERLKEAARKYTDLRVETEAAQIQFALIFMSQSAPDIRKELQKLEGEDSRSLNKMLEAAWKVYYNREKKERKIRKSRLLAIMTEMTGRGRGRGKGQGLNGRGGFTNCGNRNFNTPLGINQCALCREEGHWKRDCPKNRNVQQEIAKVMVLDD